MCPLLIIGIYEDYSNFQNLAVISFWKLHHKITSSVNPLMLNILRVLSARSELCRR